MAGSQKSEDNKHRYRGLKNTDSTCYLNAVLQTLFMTKEFREHVERLDEKGVSSDGNIIRELNKLFNDLEKPEKNAGPELEKPEKNAGSELEKQKERAVSTDGVVKSLSIDVCQQRDAAELLHLILEKTGSSELFKGTYSTTITWPCGHKQENSDAFLSLPVSLKHYQDVEKTVTEYIFQTCGEYHLNCHCKKTGCKTCIRKSGGFTFPKLLSIQLRSSGDWIKVYSHMYELYAIVNYEDTARGGHYYADIECGGGIWRRFDDHSVSVAFINTLGDESSTVRSSDACLLVYRQRKYK